MNEELKRTEFDRALCKKFKLLVDKFFSFCSLKAGVNMNLSEILRSLKRDKKGKKKVMEHHQTVARPHNDTPGCWAIVRCVSTNFNFKL